MSVFLVMSAPPARSTHFPYTTLFRSGARFGYAAPLDGPEGPEAFGGLRVATSYPNVVRHDLERRGVDAQVVRLDGARSEEHTSELQSRGHLVCRRLLEKKKGPR